MQALLVLKPLALPFLAESNSQIYDPDDAELDHYLFQQDNAQPVDQIGP